MIDPQKARERLLPQGWKPWQKPRRPLEIDEWVAKQKFERGVLPPHIEQDGCPYWYVRRGVVTAVHMADQQARQWTEKQKDLKFATKPEYIAAIHPAWLRRLVELYIEKHLPKHQFNVLRAAEESERDLIGMLVRKISQPANGP